MGRPFALCTMRGNTKIGWTLSSHSTRSVKLSHDAKLSCDMVGTLDVQQEGPDFELLAEAAHTLLKGRDCSTSIVCSIPPALRQSDVPDQPKIDAPPFRLEDDSLRLEDVVFDTVLETSPDGNSRILRYMRTPNSLNFWLPSPNMISIPNESSRPTQLFNLYDHLVGRKT